LTRFQKARANHPDFELTMGRYWSGNPNRRQAAADYLIDDSDSDISAVMPSWCAARMPQPFNGQPSR
jgi:hypothetical protein